MAKKNSPSAAADEESSLVAGVRLLSLRLRGLVLGCFTSKSLLVSLSRVFHSTPLHEQVPEGAKMKNPVLRTRLFFVDYMIEISNLDLMGDILILLNAFP